MSALPTVGGLVEVDELETVIDGLVCGAPAGTTARLDLDGDAETAPELLWSARCAEIPATRAVVLLDGPGSGDVTADFEHAHRAAEEVAGRLSAGADAVGPIEVLVFRPRPGDDGAVWPRPTPTADGARFRFRHRGGATVHLALTIPTTPGGA